MEVVVQVNSVEAVLLVIPAVGGVISWVMMMEAVLVQPLLAVTVTIYVSGLEKLLLSVPVVVPPLHAYESPPEAVTLIEVVVQLSSVEPVLLVITAVGTEASWVITIDEVLVQPFVPVTVTVYVFGLENVLFAVPVDEPPLQEYVSPPVAVTLMEVVVQVNSVEAVLLVIPAVGGVIF